MTPITPPLILLSTWLRFFKVQSVDILRAGVAQKQRRVVGRHTEPDVEVTSLAEVLQIGNN
jgi:hypothetical protein